MKLTTGAPVEGENFFDRENELRILWDRLQHEHVLMLAPRRIGKTSILKKLLHDAEQQQFKAAGLCYFARCQTELDCINEILSALDQNYDGFLQAFKNRMSRIKSVSISLSGAKIDFDQKQPEVWRTVGEELAQTLKQTEDKWLIAVDELPVFILALLKQDNGVQRSRQFLDWFRSLRQQHYQHIHWILAGSIGLDTVAARNNLGDTINDLTIFPLGAFTNETAQRFLNALASSYELEIQNTDINYIIQCVGWPVPYYLQLLFSRIRERLLENESTIIDQALVDSAYEDLLTPSYKGYFDYWNQRLTEELGEPDASYARVLLSQLCRDQSGTSKQVLEQTLSKLISDPAQKDQKLNFLLDVLINDGYLFEHLDTQENNPKRYQFRLEWLREYWRRRIAS